MLDWQFKNWIECRHLLLDNEIFVIHTDVDGVNHFPDDFDDIPRRNDTARARRRDRYPSSPRVGTFVFYDNFIFANVRKFDSSRI